MNYKGNDKYYKIGMGTSNSVNEYDNTNSSADGYNHLLEVVKRNFSNYAQNGYKLFTTNVLGEAVYEAFLENLPVEARQHYTCRSCRNFLERYGNLVLITDTGEIKSVMWDENNVPAFFGNSVYAMRLMVEGSRVNGVFLASEMNLGTPVTGAWEHLSVQQPRAMRHVSKVLTAEQTMAVKKEDYKMLHTALIKYPVATVERALTLLKSESLYRSEKVLGIAEWFREVHAKRNGTRNKRHQENLLWLAVATAPTGFTHISSSMIGTLLEDLASGMNYNEVSKRFAAKMNPTQYQRPQAAPKAGNILQAEKLVEKLGIQQSLARRFARLEELKAEWLPKPKMEARVSHIGTGMFRHLNPKVEEKTLMTMPQTTMTWEKFVRTVLPLAESMDYYVRSDNDNYSAILTAENYYAPPILQWDEEEQRNPFSWYLYNSGSAPSRWNLTGGRYVKVTAVTNQPSMWYSDKYKNQGSGVFLILEGAKDYMFQGAGNALFPEILKSELREIRSTIESYSKGETVGGYDEATACGVRLQNQGNLNALIRVTTNSTVTVYKIDRWD
jgi:hypothetical protein